LSGKVTSVIHVFPEDDAAGQEMHLRYWYGTVRPISEYPEDEDDDESPIVCWCGGRHVQLREDVVAVWHMQSWNQRGL
jgi:hypothetical protein